MSNLLTMDGWGQRAATFRFELLDHSNSYIGVIDIDTDSIPNIENSINRTVKRKMSGLKLPPSTTRDINTISDRVRPVMIFQDGSEYNLGIFLFADASRTEWIGSSVQYASATEKNYTTDATMLDQLMTLDQNTNGVNFYPPGKSIYDAIIQQFEAGGVLAYEIDFTSAVIRGGSWVSWPIAEKRLTIINDLLSMGGYYSLYYDNDGVAQARLVPDLDSTAADFIYGPGMNVLQDPPPMETDDLLEAPNQYVVVNTSFTDFPVWGAWNVPSSAPNSYANRGFYVVKKVDQQGIESNADAKKAAKAIGQSDYATYRWVDFSTTIDPRHDTFNIVEWNGDKFREQSWNYSLQDGASMSHELRRVWQEDDPGVE